MSDNDEWVRDANMADRIRALTSALQAIHALTHICQPTATELEIECIAARALGLPHGLH